MIHNLLDIKKVKAHGREFETFNDCSAHLFNDDFEADEVEQVRGILKPGDIVFDVGAHVGYYTLLMSDLVGEEGHVHAFEMTPITAGVLKSNVKSNKLTNVTVNNAAVHCERGTVRVYFSPDNTGDNRAFKSLRQPDRPSIEVAAITLDEYAEAHDIMRKVKFIKMDIQSHELSAIKGAENLIFDSAPVFSTEYWPWGLKEAGINPGELLELCFGLDYKPFSPSGEPLDAGDLLRRSPDDEWWFTQIFWRPL